MSDDVDICDLADALLNEIRGEWTDVTMSEQYRLVVSGPGLIAALRDEVRRLRAELNRGQWFMRSVDGEIEDYPDEASAKAAAHAELESCTDGDIAEGVEMIAWGRMALSEVATLIAEVPDESGEYDTMQSWEMRRP